MLWYFFVFLAFGLGKRHVAHAEVFVNQNPRIFVIISSQRCGTNMLEGVFVPGVACCEQRRQFVAIAVHRPVTVLFTVVCVVASMLIEFLFVFAI